MIYEKSQISFTFYAVLLCVAFGLNFAWEISQTFAFQMSGTSSGKMLLFCASASVIDAVVTILIFWILQSILKRYHGKLYFAAAVLGAVCAVFFEQTAFALNLWSYNEEMPVLPFLGTGLLPFLQLTLLVPAAIWVTITLKRRKLC